VKTSIPNLIEIHRIEVLRKVVMKSSAFWDTMPCDPLKAVRKWNSDFQLLHAGFLLGLFFDTEDGGAMFLRSVG
jgi:hypothetical protein